MEKWKIKPKQCQNVSETITYSEFGRLPSCNHDKRPERDDFNEDS